jgi:P27 family predicted phage terminase small subunit
MNNGLTRGRRPKPTAIRRREGNRGKRAWNHDEPIPPDGIPRCPDHLGPVARTEWRRVARALHGMGVLTLVDRAALAAYCAAYGRWVEAEQKLKEAPTLYKTASGYVQQSPWLGIANKQLELMGRYMTELGMTPAARSRVSVEALPTPQQRITITLVGGPDDTPSIETIDAVARRAEPQE